MAVYDPNNKRHISLGDNAHSEDRAIFFRVNYDPISREGQILFQHRPYLYVDGNLVGVMAQGEGRSDKLYRNLVDLIQRKPAAGVVVDPVTGTDLATVSGAGIQTWIEWLFDELSNEEQE